ncbi:SH3 beta-barrel fold-containing protein [Fibrella forsythiae]|uniref:DUF2693 domain-containing protein n=1 Tax=Fibrella forsythiae TaxID=2817061 RepID=A0ABS3JBU3_9BACT|nr:SH3 beta-barrel fold-containing protein [Fibrella forsythiae]MBO0947470.1 DUF2693 domain-containing protein [Fibrella forsythiae]
MLNQSGTRNAALRLAWQLVRKSALSFADAQRAAWKAIRLKIKLATTAAVDFTYRKTDGSIRQARGTRMIDYTATSTAPVTDLTVRYFDLDATGWRSCRADHILAIL